MRSNAPNSRRRILRCANDDRHVRNLAAALSSALNITPGTQLIMSLGAGDERSNLQALETWVRIELTSLGSMTSQQQLGELLSRLERRLVDHTEVGL